MVTLKIATYNIHKGLSYFKRRVVLHELRERLRELDADVVFLQEVQGEHALHGERYHDYPAGTQHEFISEAVWPHTVYGKNAVYEAGHHGNAILSRYPILCSTNTDVSAHRFEHRGLLHCEIQLPVEHGAGGWKSVHCLCAHFGLFARGRRAQASSLIDYVRKHIPEGAPLIIAGDFNDWSNQLSRTLSSELHIHDVFHLHGGSLARSFPSRLPLLRLDRIYVRGFDVFHSAVHTGGNWLRLSDHAALSANLRLQAGRGGRAGVAGHQVAGNLLSLLKNGVEYFPRLCMDIDAAQHSVYLETYIFAADQAGRMVADALMRAALRGISVRVLLDGYGSAELPREWVEELRAARVEVLWFRREISPFTLKPSRLRRLRRLHRKLVVVDGEIAFAGGINVIDDRYGLREVDAPRLDYAVRIEGELAGEIHAAMRRLWGIVSWASLRRRGKEIRQFLLDRIRHPATSDVVFLLRDNFRHRRDIERSYLKAIVTAQREIIIANAYFLPGRSFRQALILAAQRGVKVVLLLQGRVEYRLQYYATHALYDQLLEAGVEIHEYHASFLHAKVAVVDGVWATVGSSNIDPFSLGLAREANIAIRDTSFAAELRASLLQEMDRGARPIDTTVWRRQGPFMRILARISYGLVRVLAGVAGYMRGHDDA